MTKLPHPLTPCLWLDGKARQAAALYCTVFPDSEILSESPMVVNFSLAGQPFMSLNGGPAFSPNPSISFFVMCGSLSEIDAMWEALSDGGSAMMPIDSYPWARRYGWVQDRFGVSWQLSYEMTLPTEQKISPAFMFTGAVAGRAEEAIALYTSVFDGSSVRTIQRYAAGEHDVEGTIKHAQFSLAGRSFAAMDSSAGHQFGFSEGVSIVVACDTQEEIDAYWTALSSGGSEGQCGWLKDKFGVSWQVVPTVLATLLADNERSPRVVQAFLQMKKFDIAALLRA